MKVNQNIDPRIIILKIDRVRISHFNIKTNLFQLQSVQHINKIGCFEKDENFYKGKKNNETIFEYEPSKSQYFARTYMNGKLHGYRKYLVDARGNRTHFYTYDKNGKELDYSERKYDKNNLNTEFYSNDGDQGSTEIFLYEKLNYNKKRQLIKSELLDCHGSITYWTQIEYDDKGRPLRYENHIGRNRNFPSHSSTNIIYHNSRFEERISSSGEILKIYFNKSGLKILQERTLKGELIQKIKYEYEKNGEQVT